MTAFSRYLFLAFLLVCFACSLPAEQRQENQQASPSQDTLTEVPSEPAPESQKLTAESTPPVKTGAEVLIEQHLQTYRGKRIGLVANHTTLVDGVHLVDTLLSLGLEIRTVFAPEHGFRGAADAGQKIQNATDPKTGLPILSLYGKNRKPTLAQIQDLDVLIFDIQDIGSRHYTYIGTMTYAMEACAEAGKPFVVLDRPNPNGWYTGGPILDRSHSSFIGMHSVPIVHGLTVGEYASMVNGEQWMANGVQADLQVVPCEGYVHAMRWEDTGLNWTPPSPNIPTEYAAYLYPALCWFEPTLVSIGRGTHEAFTQIGAPWFTRFAQAKSEEKGFEVQGLTFTPYSFTPVSIPGKSTYPKYQDETCYGMKFHNRVAGDQLFLAGLTLLQWMYTEAQTNIPEQGFFTGNFERWAGNTLLETQIKNRIPVEEIAQSWVEGLNNYNQIRSNYLMYD